MPQNARLNRVLAGHARNRVVGFPFLKLQAVEMFGLQTQFARTSAYTSVPAKQCELVLIVSSYLSAATPVAFCLARCSGLLAGKDAALLITSWTRTPDRQRWQQDH